MELVLPGQDYERYFHDNENQHDNNIDHNDDNDEGDIKWDGKLT